MGFRIKNKEVITADGVPYMWNSGDCSTTATFLTKLVPQSPTVFDLFGSSVSVGSGRIVVGAYNDYSLGIGAGSAYIYDINGTYIQKITASDGVADDQFGYSVAVGSGRIVVGSPYDDDRGADSGSAYIYDLNGNFLKKITASDGVQFDRFGVSVSIGSGKIVIGSDNDDDRGADSGSAYIYDLNGNFLKKITAPDGSSGDLFGRSVSAGSGRIVIGATGDDDRGSNSGSLYVLDTNGNFISKLTSPDGAAADIFGSSVSVGSGRIVVGSPWSDSGPISNAGSAYIYDLNGVLIKKITTPYTSSDSNEFGSAVYVGSGRIVVAEFGSSTVYTYDLDGNFIQSFQYLGIAFGSSVAVSSGRIIIGAGYDGNGSAYVYSTPRVYTLHDAIEMNFR